MSKKHRPEPTDAELLAMLLIAEKYRLSDRDILLLGLLQRMLAETGFGRNEHTARLCRAIADVIEAPIRTAESLDAQAEGKLQ